MMAWLYQRNQSGCRYCLTPSLLFDMVGLYKKSRKTVGILFHACCVVGNQLEATYKLIYWYLQKIRVQCPEFGADLVAGLLKVNWQTQHGVDKGVG